METKDKIIEEIKKIYDPELPVNIYDLGLIYDVNALSVTDFVGLPFTFIWLIISLSADCKSPESILGYENTTAIIYIFAWKINVIANSPVFGVTAPDSVPTTANWSPALKLWLMFGTIAFAYVPSSALVNWNSGVTGT